LFRANRPSPAAPDASAKFIRTPELAEAPYPVKMAPNLVVEFYAS
jgi:small subunit ribosomal protein S4